MPRPSRAYLELVLEHVRAQLGSRYPTLQRQLLAASGARGARLADAPNAAELAGLQQLGPEALDTLSAPALKDLRKRARRWRRYVAQRQGDCTGFDALLERIEAKLADVVKGWRGRVVKYDEEMGIVTGVVMVPEEPDLKDGDVASAEEIFKACCRFAIRYRVRTAELALQHKVALEDEQAVLVENYCLPEPLTMGSQDLPAGTWIQSWYLGDEALREAFKGGQLTGFSIGGTITRHPLEAAA